MRWNATASRAAHTDWSGGAMFMTFAVLVCIVIWSSLSPALAGDRPQRVDIPDISDTSTPHGPGALTDMWRELRLGQPTSATSPGGAGTVLIQSEGSEWQARRSRVVINYGGMILVGIIALISIYFVLRGRIRIEGGRTGKVMPRFTLVQRVVHWSVAVLFGLLGLSGLILLFGRDLLLPIMPPEAFAILASASMQGHNLLGPLFIPAILALLFTFAKGNGYRLVDIKWLFKAGGFLGGHASSHKYNFGEKTWFWWAVILGAVLCASGIALLFPTLTGTRVNQQIADLIHAGAAILMIAFALGHVYLGTIGMEGALEGMTRGTVDTNWAREHHDLWHDELKETATTDTSRAEVIAAASGDAVPQGEAS